MTAYSRQRAERELAALIPKHSVFLFHGPEAGIVKSLARLTSKKSGVDLQDPFSTIRLSEAEISQDPGRLFDEINTLPLIGGKRLIWIEIGGKHDLPGLEAALDASPSSSQLIIESGELEAGSRLRSVCEKHSQALSVLCNQDTEEDIRTSIQEALKSHSISINSENLSYLVSLLPQDRLTWQSEIEKLLLAASEEKQVDRYLIEALITDGDQIAPDKIVTAALSGNLSELISAWIKAEGQGVESSITATYALRRLTYGRGGYGREQEALSSSMRYRAGQTIASSVRAGRREPRLIDAFVLRALLILCRRR